MLPILVLTFLQAAVSIAMGAGTLFVPNPSVISGGPTPHGIADAARPKAADTLFVPNPSLMSGRLTPGGIVDAAGPKVPKTLSVPNPFLISKGLTPNATANAVGSNVADTLFVPNPSSRLTSDSNVNATGPNVTYIKPDSSLRTVDVKKPPSSVKVGDKDYKPSSPSYPNAVGPKVADTLFVPNPFSRLTPNATGPNATYLKQDLNLRTVDVKKPLGGVKVGDKDYKPSSPSHPNSLLLPGWSYGVCKKGAPIMKNFTQSFMNKVKSSKKLKKAFRLQGFTAKSLGSLLHDEIYKIHSSIGSPDAQASARVASQAVKVNFHKAKKNSLLRVFAYATAKYLFYRGALNPSNVSSLSRQYFEFTKRNISSLKKPDPETNFKAIDRAFDEFLMSLGLYDKHSSNMISRLFANEWYTLRRNKHSVC